MRILRSKSMLTQGNGYIYPFVLWLSLIFFSYIIASVEIYNNNVEIYDELMDQLEVQSMLIIAKENINQKAQLKREYDASYEININQQSVVIKKQTETSERVLFSATIEINHKKYPCSFFLNSVID